MQRMPFFPPQKRAGDLPSSATVAGAGSGLGVLVFVLAPQRVVGRGGLGLMWQMRRLAL